MYTRAKKILASELMYALEKTEDEAEAYLDHVLDARRPGGLRLSRIPPGFDARSAVRCDPRLVRRSSCSTRSAAHRRRGRQRGAPRRRAAEGLRARGRPRSWPGRSTRSQRPRPARDRRRPAGERRRRRGGARAVRRRLPRRLRARRGRRDALGLRAQRARRGGRGRRGRRRPRRRAPDGPRRAVRRDARGARRGRRRDRRRPHDRHRSRRRARTASSLRTHDRSRALGDPDAAGVPGRRPVAARSTSPGGCSRRPPTTPGSSSAPAAVRVRRVLARQLQGDHGRDLALAERLLC